MRYREYRRKCKDVKEKHIVAISKYIYLVGTVRNKMTPGMIHRWDVVPEDGGPYDYFHRIWRGRRSSYLKKMFARKLRRSPKVNMIAWKGSDYKRASGDFWWEYD